MGAHRRLGGRDMAAALTVMESDFENSRGRGEIPRLVGQLGGHLHKLTAMKRLLEEGVAPKDAAGKLGMKPFPAQKLARQADGFSVEELRDASVRLARLDHRAEGRQPARAGARAPARDHRSRSASPASEAAATPLRGDALRRGGCLRLLPRGGVLVQRPAGGGTIDRAHELTMLGADRGLVAVFDAPSRGA